MTNLPLPEPRRAPVLDIIAWHPGAAFALFLAVQFTVWTALPTLVYHTLPLDGIEALIYGREWQLGYAKLPPLPWWLAEAAFRILPTDATLYALSQLFVVATFAIVWATARPLVGGRGALVAVLIIGGLDYFQSASTSFDHDVAQLPFWALTGAAFHAALRGGRSRDWALLGLALGGAFWAKYFVVVLALPIALFLVLDRDARPHLKRPGPWIALAIALLVALPHLIWLVQHDFLPLAYVERRAAPSRGLLDHVVHPAQTVLAQLGYLLPSLLIAAPLAWFAFQPRATAPEQPAARPHLDQFDRRIVTLLAFGPAATLVLLSAVTGRGTIPLWGYPLWLYLGLWFVMVHDEPISARGLAWVAGLWAAVFAVSAILIVAFNSGAFGLKYLRRSHGFPGPQLAAEAERRYVAATGHGPAYVVGPMLEAGNISRYAAGRPRVVIDADFARAPWIDPADLRARGALLVWEPTEDGQIPDQLAKLADGATVQAPIVVPVAGGRFIFNFAWAILPPR